MVVEDMNLIIVLDFVIFSYKLNGSVKITNNSF
jgi:hypothetical protein